YEPKGRGFESLLPYKRKVLSHTTQDFFFYAVKKDFEVKSTVRGDGCPSAKRRGSSIFAFGKKCKRSPFCSAPLQE
ncbi:MAG: hypothetical protein IJX71_01355, partial [Oscillospiraceae bacterium]|nr:hypothetical protein [Oscillospiraceae bacterium]